MNNDPTSLIAKSAADVPFPSNAPWTPLFGASVGGLASSGVDVNPISALQLATAQACIERVCSDCSKVPLHLYRGKGKLRQRVHEHPLIDLLARPNRRNTRAELIYMIVLGYMIQGNGYAALVLDERNGNTLALIPMPIGRTNIIERPDGVLEYRCSSTLFHGYKTSKPAQRTRNRAIEEDEMIHLRRMSLDGVRGTSVLTTASEVFGLGLAAQTSASRTFKNGGRHQIALKSPVKLTDQLIQQTQNDYARQAAGAENSGKPLVLGPDVDVEKLDMSPVDMQLHELLANVSAEICRLFGVPAGLLGVGAATNSETQTYKNLQQDMEFYTESTLASILNPLAEILNNRLLFEPNGRAVPAGGALRGEYEFVFDIAALARPDTQSRYSTYKLGIESGFLTEDEARAEEGRAPLPKDERPEPMKDKPGPDPEPGNPPSEEQPE